MPQSDPFPDQNVNLPEPKSDHRDAAESDHIDEDSSLHDELLPSHSIRRNGETHTLEFFTKFAEGYEGQRFNLRSPALAQTYAAQLIGLMPVKITANSFHAWEQDCTLEEIEADEKKGHIIKLKCEFGE